MGMENADWLLRPYFAQTIEKEFPKIIQARKDFERGLAQILEGNSEPAPVEGSTNPLTC